MIFYVGDKVKIEGVIEANYQSQTYPLVFKSKGGSFSITRDGKMGYNNPVCVELLERPKPKVKKYLVVFKSIQHGYFEVSLSKYKSLEDFDTLNKASKAISLIQESEEEFDE